MKSRFILFRRAGVFYSEDTTTRKQHSLRTKDEAEALTLLHSKNEAHRQPVLNLHIARTYLTATDPDTAKRTWQVPMDEMTKTKTGPTRHRHETAMKDKAFDRIRNLAILETHSAHFLKVLELGGVSTNVYLRRIHNFALDMNWLPWSVLPKRQGPKVKFKEKRAITLEEHQRIIAAERNPERKTLYQLCWHLGASQGDIANLKGEDVDWTSNTVSFIRKKSGVPVIVNLGAEALNVFKDLPAEGVLFPYLSCVRAGDRATEFCSRCRQLGIKGVTLHSYRYAWAERAKVAGMPERFAQEALGHNSKAVHRAYAKRALMRIPSLEDYERKAEGAALDTPAAPASRWITHEVDTANGLLLPILPLCFRDRNDSKKGSRFTSLTQLQRWIALHLPAADVAPPLTGEELDQIVSEMEQYLCELIQRKCRVPSIVEKEFISRDFTWKLLDKRLLVAESVKGQDTRVPTKVLSHCSIFDQVHGPAMKAFSDFMAKSGRPNHSLYIYDGEIIPEPQLLAFIKQNPSKDGVVILHHQELATLIDSDFTTLTL